MIDLPLILYVPGLLTKPEPRQHRDALFRCLIAGVRRQSEKVALDIAANLHCFDLVSWNYDFYCEHRDYNLDAAAVDAVIEQPQATEADVSEAQSWQRWSPAGTGNSIHDVNVFVQCETSWEYQTPVQFGDCVG